MTHLMLALGLALAPPALAAEGAALPADLNLIANRIGLEEEARGEVAELLYAHNIAQVDLESEQRKARLQLEHELSIEEPDRKAVFRALDALSEAEANIRRHKIELVLDLRTHMSAQQWQKLEMLQKQKRKEQARAAAGSGPMP